MKLYSLSNSCESHRMALIALYKDVEITRCIIKDESELPEQIKMNMGKNNLPILDDRGNVVSSHTILMEYIEERYPLNPLMTTIPFNRSKLRLFCLKIHMEWYSLINVIESTKDDKVRKIAKNKLLDGILASLVIFDGNYILEDRITMADCAVLPVLWRLNYYDIKIPEKFSRITEYAERFFKEDQFKNSLAGEEKTMQIEKHLE